jgi:hypothetical protein
MALFAPDRQCCHTLTEPLSGLFSQVGVTTARKYANALRRFLDAAQANSGEIAGLFVSVKAARATITHWLVNAGCRLRPHRLPNGAICVTPPSALVPTIDAALIGLSHLYDGLANRGRLDFDNPIVTGCGPTPLIRSDNVHLSSRHFVLTNRRTSVPRRDDPHCLHDILVAARDWPPFIRLATTIAGRLGPRMTDLFRCDVADWAASGFGETIACTDKGSRGVRTKLLFLDEDLWQQLAAYFDGPRHTLTKISLADLRRLARADPEHDALSAPLLLNSRGRRLKYSLYNDYYFRPAVRKLRPGVTPHWMRHEVAFNGLSVIAEIARDDAERLYLEAVFAAMMGWRSGPGMAHYYAPQIQDAQQRELAEVMARTLREAGTLPPTHPAAGPQPSPARLAILAAGAV